jgi:hypothetical protein
MKQFCQWRNQMLIKLKALYSRISQAWRGFKALCEKDLTTLWSEYHTWLILIGAAVLTMKFRALLVDFIINGSKKLYLSSQKQSESLQVKKDANNKAADALVQQAAELPSTETPVDDDWNKK